MVVFDKDDIYCSGSGVKLFTSWQPTVHKFDTSSFYSWEQDNLPVYDLDDRTHFLWEREGFPTSSIPGIAMLVSATAPGVAPNHNNVFTTLQAAIDALPREINFPVQIEIAKYGALDNVRLNGIKIGSNGCLEIINRCSVMSNSNVTDFERNFMLSSAHYGPNDDQLFLEWSGLGFFKGVSATSAVNYSKNIWNRTSWNTVNRVFIGLPEYGGVTNFVFDDLSFGKDCTNLFAENNNASGFNLNPGIFITSAEDFSASAYELGVINELTETVTHRMHVEDNKPIPQQPPSIEAVGAAYANFFSGVEVIDCEGPIYIRNFCVDGGSGTGNTYDHNVTFGFSVLNSSKVTLENCAAVRCKQAGFLIQNSNVTLSRRCIAYRNYEFGSDTITPRLQRRQGYHSAGLRAINSNVNVSAQIANVGWGRGSDSLFAFCNNPVGIDLINSRLFGGKDNYSSTDTTDTPITTVNSSNQYKQFNNYITVANNYEAGIKLSNAFLDTRARICLTGNRDGILGDDSTLHLRSLKADFNQKAGVRLNNCSVLYNSDLFGISGIAVGNFRNQPRAFGTQFYFDNNGQHIVLKNSTFRFPYVSSVMLDSDGAIVSGYPYVHKGYFHCTSAFGAQRQDSVKVALPSISLDNSYMDLINPWIHTNPNINDGTGQAIYGAAISAKNNSFIRLNGTKGHVTNIRGPESDSTKIAGIYLENSKGLICGPTIISNFGVDVLANNNSLIEFSPHKNEDGTAYDPVGWQLDDPDNHTHVELHSTRACLVADNGSIIKMHDLGDYNNYWGSTLTTALGLSSTYNPQDELKLKNYTVSAYVQFFPNPVAGNTGFTYPTVFNASSVANAPTTQGNANNYHAKTLLGGPFPTGNPTKHKLLSYGGVCVRALNGSHVDVRNVNFPTGFENPSGIVYDTSTDCHRLYIWNVGSNSTMKVSHVSVSAHYPTSCVYHGPKAFYTDGAGTPLSGAPNTTTGTQTLSVLDSFGLGAQLGRPLRFYGKSTYDNRGPFRLYFSPDDAAKFLGYVSGTGPKRLVHGAPYQELSQGYNPSGDVSASIPLSWSGTGAIYHSLFPHLKQTGVSGTTTSYPASAFFYVSDLLSDVYKGSVILDDSAMNLFANAKNATLGTSNRSKLVTYIREITGPQGEGFDADQAGFGLGFLSSRVFDLSKDN